MRLPHGNQKWSKANLFCKFNFSHDLSITPNSVHTWWFCLGRMMLKDVQMELAMPWALTAWAHQAEILLRLFSAPPPASQQMQHKGQGGSQLTMKNHSFKGKKHIVAERITARVPWSMWMQRYQGHESLCVVLHAVSLAWGKWAWEVPLWARKCKWAQQCQLSTISEEWIWYSWPGRSRRDRAPVLRMVWRTASLMVLHLLTSRCVPSDHSSPANTRACRASTEKASCKFSCKKGAKEILGLNLPLLCLCDLAGTKDLQGLFWWSLSGIKCIICRTSAL